MFGRSWLAVVPLALISAPHEAAALGNCTTLDIQLQPAMSQDPENARPMQIVAWIEKPDGQYLDTMFITQAVGRYGIGNRPGRMDFNSGPRWPYGRRIATFPVWAHRHGLVFPDIVFQNGDDNNLSHPSTQSSPDSNFCAPIMRIEPEWDTGTCASVGYTDKGEFKGTTTSLYPPRQDIVKMSVDDPAVTMYDMLNPFDAVSQPTPLAGSLAKLMYAVPDSMGPGNYVMWVEVSKEFDMNGTYNPTSYPSPNVAWDEYGLAYRGQPSVIFKVPFTLDMTGETVAHAMEYVGYGDPDGIDGNIRPPDSAITANTPGSGSSRLQLMPDGSDMYRVRVHAMPEQDVTAPAAPGTAEVTNLTSSKATISFMAPGDDGTSGIATRYEIRYRANDTITAENFDSSAFVDEVVMPQVAGTVQTLEIDRLLWETAYSVGIRATDNCRNTGEIAVVNFTTPERAVGEVDACFVATAAYGSVLANDVGMLRKFRDAMLRKTIFGELAVEAYYTFGPAVSGIIGESDLLRSTTRSALDPIVAMVRHTLQ